MLSATFLGNSDWREVAVEKLNRYGKPVFALDGSHKTFRYDLEVSTGDLYGLQGDPDPAYVIALKSFGVFLLTPVYMGSVMIANLLKIIGNITSIFWKVIPQMVSDLLQKGVIATLGNAVMAIIFEIPCEIAADLCRICRSPLYAVGMEIASLYGMFSPYEGRKWIGKIESSWHDNLPYYEDVRSTTLDTFLKETFKGKILFLAICMQKMGNINDKVNGINKYIIM